MFKSRKLNKVDSIRARPRKNKVNPKKIGGGIQGKVSVHAVRPRPGVSRLSSVPEDYRTLDRGRQGGWGFLIFLFILFAASAAGFLYWTNQPPQFQGDSVHMSVVTDEEIVSGDEISFLIDYENRDVVPLISVSLDVQWPEGFYYNDASASPTSVSATTWVLGPLDPGQKKSLRIKGQLVGLKDQTQTAIFRLSYRPENISSEFEVEARSDIAISDAQIGVEFTTPEKVLAGQKVDFVAVLSNLTTEPLSDIDVEIILPKDFLVDAQVPELDDNHWRGSLPVDEPIELKITSKVALDANEPQAWVVEINKTADDIARRLLRIEQPVSPVKPEFDLDLKINGQSSDFEVSYGDSLNFQLKLTNRSTSAMNDLRVTALIDSDVIDRKTVQSAGEIAQDTITWTKEHMDQLASLETEQELIIPWKADLLEQGTVGRASVDTVITLEIDGLPDWKKNSPVFVVSVGEGLVFNQGIYWDLGGQQVGEGNIPPVTNERSVYLAIWSLDSGSQDYDSVNISTFLPQKVSFESSEEVDEGALQYDEETHRLEWQINNFSSKLLPLKAAFFLKLVPEDDDEGTIMALLNPSTIVASGEDVFENKTFSINTAQVIASVDTTIDDEGIEIDIGTVIE